jgi:glycosyltransferase involved in cell wall biosynthesis
LNHPTGEQRRPRILMVSANAYPVMGGVETHIYEVAPRLARSGFDVTLLTTDRSGTLAARDEINGVPIRRVRSWPERRDYYFAPGLLRWFRRERWDLVHCQGYHTLVPPLAMLASTLARLPYLVTFHSGGHGSRLRTRLRGAQHLALRPLLARARRLIAVSQFEREFFSRELRIPADRFATIPNGTEMALPPDYAAEDEEPSLILSVGRLERYKGHHRVIAALPYVIREIPDARLRIVGAGPYESELRRLASESGVDSRIEIGSIAPSERSAMAALLARAGLVTLLSEYEAHPVAVAEALAMRRRVLLADTSGLSELAERGMARAIPLESDAAQTAKAIVEQLRSPPPGDLELPTWDDCTSRLANVYREVLAH